MRKDSLLLPIYLRGIHFFLSLFKLKCLRRSALNFSKWKVETAFSVQVSHHGLSLRIAKGTARNPLVKLRKALLNTVGPPEEINAAETRIQFPCLQGIMSVRLRETKEKRVGR